MTTLTSVWRQWATGRQPREPDTARSGGNRLFYQPTALRQGLVAGLLVVALVAFELFNFDTTRFALGNLFGDVRFGDVRFGGVAWATILALAFCAIDFAGLVRVFTTDDDGTTPVEVWYLVAAWLLAATMNAVMTWYAVSLIILERGVTDAVLSRQQAVTLVPVFVALLVWLTRILFLGALSVTGASLRATPKAAAALPVARPAARPAPQSAPQSAPLPTPLPPRPAPRSTVRSEPLTQVRRQPVSLRARDSAESRP